MPSLLHLSPTFNKNVKINFEGGNLSSDSGLLLLKEFDEKIGFSKCIKEKFNDFNKNKRSRIHSDSDILIQKIYQKCSGYHTDDASDELRFDPVFTQILEKDVAASQPTVSRFNTRSDKSTLNKYTEINNEIIDKVYNHEHPEHIVLDLDSTNCSTYGDQFGAAYNYHYGENGYHPLLLFDGLTGDCLKAELRAGNVYTSRQVVRFIGPVLKRYSSKYPSTYKIVRADSGFAIPGLYEILELNGTAYAIRLKANKTLYAHADIFLNQLYNENSTNLIDYKVIYGEFMYKASSWDKARRVVVKIEKPEGRIDPLYTFIVTTMETSPKSVIMFYCNRGTMENFIKEGKNGFAFDKLSSSNFITNANKLQQTVLAYNLINWFKRLSLPSSAKSFTIATIRTKLFKVASKIVTSGRYKWFKMCSSYPYKELFQQIFNKIGILYFST